MGKRSRAKKALKNKRKGGAIAGVGRNAGGRTDPIQADGRRLIDKLRSSSGDARLAFLKEAGRVAGELRRRGFPEDARALAATAPGATPRLALEEALAALVQGDLAGAELAAARSPAAARVVGPLLDAAADRTVRRTPRGASDPLAALYSVARACGGHSSKGGPSRARSAFRKIPAAIRPALGVDDLACANELFFGTRRARASNLRTFAMSSAGRSHDVQVALARTWIERNPDASHGVGTPLGLTPEAWGIALRDVARGQVPDNASPGALASLAARYGIEMFRKEDEAKALLYRGFGLLHDEPEAALKAFDRARAKGADLVECLRGSVLAGDGLLATHEPSPSQIQSVFDSATRLAELFGKTPCGAPFAIRAWMDAITLASLAGDPRAVAKLATEVRSVVKANDLEEAGVQAELLLQEGFALRIVKPAEARVLVERATALAPKNVEAWHARFSMADEEDRDEILRQAVEATGDPELRRMAEHRGAISVKLPDRVTPGRLAVELRRRAEHGIDLWEGLEDKRDALDPAPRAAVEVAALLFSSDADQEDATRALFASRLAAANAPEVWRALFACAIELEIQGLAARICVARAKEDTAPVLDAISIALSSSLKSLAQTMLLDVHAHLAPREVLAVKKLIASRRPRVPVTLHKASIMDAVHDALHPEFCLHDLDDDDPRAEHDDHLSGLASILAGLGPRGLEDLLDLVTAGAGPAEGLKRLAAKTGRSQAELLQSMGRMGGRR